MSDTTPNITLSACVMTHPDRVAAARELRRRHPELDLAVVVDPDPRSPVRSALRTARVAWGSAAPEATHHLVLQDDTVLSEGFGDRVAAAVAERPDEALSFFTEWGSRTASLVRAATLLGRGWAAVVDSYVPTQATVLPAALAREFAVWDAGEETADDQALGHFLRQRGVRAHVSVPNLAEHDDEAASVVGNSFMGPRRSACHLPDPPPQATGTTMFDQTLYLSWMRGVAEWQRTADPVFGAGPAPGALDHLRSRGIDRADVAAAHESCARALYAEAPEAAAVSPVLLFELFAGYYCLGHHLAESGQPVTAGVDDPLVRAAFATAAPGAFRRFLDVGYLDRCRAALGAFTLNAVRLGVRGAAPAGT